MLNPYEQYKKVSINTMTKGELLLLLFDEAIKKLNYSIILMENNDFVQANANLDKCRSIFNHLIFSLDEKFELSSDLKEIYLFFNREIIKAVSFKSKEKIEAILPIVKDMRDTWEEADKIARASKC